MEKPSVILAYFSLAFRCMCHSANNLLARACALLGKLLPNGDEIEPKIGCATPPKKMETKAVGLFAVLSRIPHPTNLAFLVKVSFSRAFEDEELIQQFCKR